MGGDMAGDHCAGDGQPRRVACLLRRGPGAARAYAYPGCCHGDCDSHRGGNIGLDLLADGLTFSYGPLRDGDIHLHPRHCLAHGQQQASDGHSYFYRGSTDADGGSN